MEPKFNVLTIGWYKMQTTASPNSEVNFEVQLNSDTNEFKIVHGILVIIFLLFPLE